MSLFGAMNTAISGLTAQSNAFANISDNVANSQTVGYKRVDTSFIDYLTTSTALTNNPGAVVTKPDYVNDVQGTVTQTDGTMNLAITGQGFFAVSQETSDTNNIATFNPQQFYSRAGDFTMNKDGYLVNSAGDFLNGWPVNSATGVANQNALAPIQVTQTVYNPVATSSVSLSANLPATPASGTATGASPLPSTIDVYDSLGSMHVVTLNWVQLGINTWQVSVNSPTDIAAAARGTATVQFGASSGNPVPQGTIGQISTTAATAGTVTTSGYTAGQAATMSFTTNFGTGPQTISVNLGTYGQTNGVTQYAGTQYQLQGLTQNGVPPGAYSSTDIQSNGDVVVNYNNGQTRTIAQVPLITFNDPNQLQRQNGQSFTATERSGTPLAEQASTNGAGNLVTSAVESSNVDIATEFSQLIVAQQAYAANSKIVTTANQMVQQTIDMKQ